jgi:hypothetical protein
VLVKYSVQNYYQILNTYTRLYPELSALSEFSVESNNQLSDFHAKLKVNLKFFNVI